MQMSCPVCFDKDIATTPNPLLAECLDCGHMWEMEMRVTANYNQQYMAERYDAYDTTEVMSHLRLGFVSGVCNSGKLLDVGYGNGSFLKLAAKAGFDAYGNDVHKVDYGVHDVELVSEDRWNVITFFDSLEHFTSLEGPRHAASRADNIVISFPCRPPLFPVRSKDWKHFRPGEHLHYFSLKSLTRFFEPKRLVRFVDLEDVIRGSRGGLTNIMTVVFSNPD